jgi:SAM-dependent methyltransferase
VHLLDAVPLHVEQAKEASSHQPDSPFTAVVGDARDLPYEDAAADAVVLFGPLYHLTERADRQRALTEAKRILRPGGVMLASAISRFASLSDGLKYGFLEDPAFAQIVDRDLDAGQHRNPGDHPNYFTTAFFHHPRELEQEITDGGLKLEALVAIEGPAMLIPDLDSWWQDEERRDQLLGLIARVEREPSLMGVSPHLMAIGRRP